MTALDPAAAALARLYDLDLAEDPGDLDLYLALAARAGDPIVELAVGTGRVAVPLAVAGHRVTGIDLDPAMLARARAAALGAGSAAARRLRLVEGDLLDAQLPGPAAAGLVILALNSILLLASRDLQRRAFGTIARLLRPGGLAIVDAWQPAAEDLVRFDGRLSLEWLRRDPDTGRDVAKLAAAWYDAASRIVTLTVLYDEAAPGEAPVRWTRSDPLRLVSADELRGFAEEAGLEVEVVAGSYDLSPIGPGGDRAIVVARRPHRPRGSTGARDTVSGR